MDNAQREKKSMVRPTLVGVAGLFLSGVILYAGNAYAMRDVCAARERFETGAYVAMAVAVASALLLVWSAARHRSGPNMFIASASALACLGLALVAFAAIWVGVNREVAPEVYVRGGEGARFGFSGGFRISQIEVRGPRALWSIRAVDQRRPPLIGEVGDFTLGRAPEGYVEVEPLKYDPGSLPDGDYVLTATSPCAYRPAQASFTVRQGRVVAGE